MQHGYTEAHSYLCSICFVAVYKKLFPPQKLAPRHTSTTTVVLHVPRPVITMMRSPSVPLCASRAVSAPRGLLNMKRVASQLTNAHVSD